METFEALLIGLELASAMGMRSIHVKKGDSQLVVRQVIAEYEAKQHPYTKRALPFSIFKAHKELIGQAKDLGP
ncbi:Hypothetical predicted protein [Olea europaea subsp. europaea]|uniref:RNase H type-1 domain-containing protein n=1 Tax=Olea europaea subsp. europaea TaxID=158383 RepID=A0A8S0VEV8_OLEEU|nr:Hypothetical predicted protein [Olea europaea subsp. europaea]